MFVVDRVSANAEIRDQVEMDAILAQLAEAGHSPVLRSMVAAAAKVASVGGRDLSVDAFVNRDPRYRSSPVGQDQPVGDLVFTQLGNCTDHCYLIQPFGSRLTVFEIRHHGVPSGLSFFCKLVEQAARARLDGRRVRGMSFEWQPMKTRTIRRFTSSSRYPEVELKTKKPEYSEDELRAAELLVTAETRTLLMQLAQIGKIRAADAKLPPDLIEKLLLQRLLSKEYLVLCRKDSRTLCQVGSIADLAEGAGTRLTCPTCGRKFSDEVVQEIFAGTEVGKQLVTSSHWMTIWVTELLIKAGVEKEAIGWSATAGEDEIDIVTDTLGLRIFFELKDREFAECDVASLTKVSFRV